MANNYLITPTLIQSWQYWYNYDGEREEDVKTSFLSTLQRQRTPTTEAMQLGIDFENNIQNYCNNSFQYESSDIRRQIGDIVYGGLWQVVLKKEIECNGNHFLLYGKADVVKEDTIFDIKYTKKYDIGKFSNSVQHLLYMYCAELNNFEYLVSDGDNFWKEGYCFTNEQIQSRLLEKIYNFYSFLQNNEKYLNIFKDKWKNNLKK